MLLNKRITYCWACDYSNSTGEGNLARLFVKKTINSPVKIFTPNFFFKYKYLSPFLGILYCWFFFFLGKKNYYLNYLPLWNFFLFIFLPPNTKLGPITGGAYYDNKNNFIRKIIFPILYKISSFFLIIRSKKNYFSTNLLENYLLIKSKKNYFNYIFKYIQKKKKVKKDIDILIYYRLHKNKISNFPINWVKKLTYLKLKIHVIGDRLNIYKLYNHGYLNSNKIELLQSRSKFSLASNENIFTLFTIECINNHNKVIIDQSKKKLIKDFKKKFIFIDFKKNPDLKIFKKNF